MLNPIQEGQSSWAGREEVLYCLSKAFALRITRTECRKWQMGVPPSLTVEAEGHMELYTSMALSDEPAVCHAAGVYQRFLGSSCRHGAAARLWGISCSHGSFCGISRRYTLYVQSLG